MDFHFPNYEFCLSPRSLSSSFPEPRISLRQTKFLMRKSEMRIIFKSAFLYKWILSWLVEL